MFLAQNVILLALVLAAMIGLEPTLLKLAELKGNGLSDRAKRFVSFLSKPEILATAGMLAMLAGHFIGDGDSHPIEHAFQHLDWLAAVLVMAMMFQSLQLGRFVNRLMAGIQRASNGDERKIASKGFGLIGVISSLLSEVSVAAATARPLSTLMATQSQWTQEKLIVLMATAVGIGGGLTNFAAPSIVIAANIFGWTLWETFTHLGPLIIPSLIGVCWYGARITNHSTDAAKIPVEQLRLIDWINLASWCGVLWFGVFANPKSTVGMLAVLAISVLMNCAYALTSRSRLTHADEVVEETMGVEHTHNPIIHLFEQLWEAGLIFAFLVSLMVMGEMIAPLMGHVEAMLPKSGPLRAVALNLITHLFSSVSDNALAAYQLAPLAQTPADQIAVAWGSLTGGILTPGSNAPNLPILVIWTIAGRQMSFVTWIRRVFMTWLVFLVASALLMPVIYWITS